MPIQLIKRLQQSFWSPLLLLLFIILELGLPSNTWINLTFETLALVYLGLFLLRTVRGFKQNKSIVRRSIFLSMGIMAVSLIASTLTRIIAGAILVPNGLYFLLITVFTIIDISTRFIVSGKNNIHPTIAFVISFVGLIWLGSFLLMLPNATVRGDISFIDALFTSTSATCITGLAVLNTGSDFTFFGQVIILLLIQVGGLGILTFTNLFGLVFKGSSFRNLLFVHELVGGNDLNATYSTALKIIFFTLTVEAVGAVLVYWAMDSPDLFFAVFHSVSAFCNAGFSTLSDSLYDCQTRFNYPLQLILAALFIVGGIGYNVFYSYYQRIKYRFFCFIKFQFQLFDWQLTPPPASRDLNAYLVTRTTLGLILLGWFFFFVIEYNNTLAEHGDLGGKLAVSFFGAVTPRTAGFNSVDMSALALPTVLLYLLLMWIGGSPGSTAGGIKTTTFSIATLNIFNQIRGRDKLILYWREIGSSTINRVSSIISLSLIAVGFATFLISISDPLLDLRDIAFECFSAYATVGLSLGITADLSVFGKIVIIILMFLGRVSFLNFLIAIFYLIGKGGQKELEHPKAQVFIN